MVISLLWNVYQQWKTPQPKTEVVFFHDKVIVHCNRHKSNDSCTNKDCYFYKIGRIISCISNAKNTIDLCMYTLTASCLSNALVRARKRGVIVRIIADHPNAYTRDSKIIDLLRTGVEVRTRPSDMIMHHKFCIFDYNYDNQCLLTGSLNWTSSSVFGGNLDSVIITEDHTLIEPFRNEFNKMWINFSENQKFRKIKDFKGVE